ncbi:hypothetical protein SynBIOSE41_03669 [Synechococcus sp. BIOS-E4-1]|nr:hypothetical protein SynBIOSE41_03669 [Synechococcus sp. BIOS-E4-1]
MFWSEQKLSTAEQIIPLGEPGLNRTAARPPGLQVLTPA